MPLLASSAAVLQWTDGQSDRAALYALRKVTSGDTIDLSREFSVLKQAIMIGTTVVGSGVASVSGTIVTMPAGLSSDAAYMLVWGVFA